MRWIPAIDLSKHKVVEARGGKRRYYRALSVPLCRSACPFSLLRCLQAVRLLSGIVYLADLDALSGHLPQHDLIARLAQAFPDIQWWVDSGLCYIEDLPPSARAVIGSESLRGMAHWRCLRKRFPSALLSLDRNAAGHVLGPLALWQEPYWWPQEVILMSIGRVGSGGGPDFAAYRKERKKAPTRRYYLAGGVAGTADIQALFRQRASGALLARALYHQRLGNAFLENMKRPSRSGRLTRANPT